MPKKGYRYADRNVVCEHCGETLSALLLDRALIVGQLLEQSGPLDIWEMCEHLDVSRQTMTDVVKAFRRHYAGLVGKTIVCGPETSDGQYRWLYRLSADWQSDEGVDIQQNEAWLTKRISEELTTARDAATLAAQNVDGHSKAAKLLRLELTGFANDLTSSMNKLQFMRERLLILIEDELDATV